MICNKCNIERGDSFYIRRKVCKPCVLEKAKKRYLKNSTRPKKVKSKGRTIKCRTCLEMRPVFHVSNNLCEPCFGRWHRSKNKEKIQLSVKKYRSTEKYRKNSRDYQRNREKIDLNYKLSRRLRSRIYKICKEQDTAALKYLGCSLKEFKKHLESQFLPGMSWANYGTGGWHIDHIIPISSFNLKIVKQRRTSCHYSNLRPLWESDNCRRGALYRHHSEFFTKVVK